MTAEARSVRLRNTQARPVELHLSRGVVVLPPMGETTCAAEEAELGHIRRLRERGVLVVRPARGPEDAEAHAGAEAAASGGSRRAPSSSPRSSRSRGGTSRRGGRRGGRQARSGEDASESAGDSTEDSTDAGGAAGGEPDGDREQEDGA